MIFVFGSNTKGIHGRGAAREALDNWDAEFYNPRGLQGRSYAICTKDLSLGIRSYPLDKIAEEIEVFLHFAEKHPEEDFLVTQIGCGLAGYTPEEIAPLFTKIPFNVHLPRPFLNILEKNHKDSIT